MAGSSQHQRIASELGVDFYFAHPHASWERGANENGYDPLGLHDCKPRSQDY